MNSTIATLLLASTLAAPVPSEPLPDPLAWGYLGVRVTHGTLKISSVEPGTPAAKAGLQAEDEFVRVGSLKPQEFEEVAEHISGFRPGTAMRVEVRRGSETKVVIVRLGVRPSSLESPPFKGQQRALPQP